MSIFDFILGAGIVGISEFAKNISETVKHFFECVEIAKRMKKSSISSSSLKVEDNGHSFKSSYRCFYIPVTRNRGDNGLFSKDNKPHLLVSPKTQEILGLNFLSRFSDYFPMEAIQFENNKITPLLSRFASDSIVLVDITPEKNSILIQFYVINIIPSCDNLCYSIQFSLHNCVLDAYTIAQLKVIFSEVLEQAGGAFYKYRQDLTGDHYDRLELELRVLHRLGYDPEFTETSIGYACSIELRSLCLDARKMVGSTSATLYVILPFSFPQQAPVLRISPPNGPTKKVIPDAVWNANYTVGHIVRALQEES